MSLLNFINEFYWVLFASDPEFVSAGISICLLHVLHVISYRYSGVSVVSQWYLLLSGDIKRSPGPETLDFCCWNLNSIGAHDFLRVSLMEAYDSVYNYDLIGLVGTHLDSTIDEERLPLDGYSLHRNDHRHNIKRDGIWLYLVTVPECLVFEIQVNNRKYFFAVVNRSPTQDQSDFCNLK